MQELVQHLIDRTGISEQQANMVISAIKEFVNHKAPGISGMVDQLLGASQTESSAAGNPLQDGLGKLGGFFGN